MKNRLLMFVFLSCYSLLSAQVKVGGDNSMRFEYMTVSARVTFDSNSIIYDETSFQKSPMVYLPNGDSFILKNSLVKTTENHFQNINEIINYMAKEGWRLISTEVIQNKFDLNNSQQNRIINSEYDYNFLEQLIFERQITKWIAN